MKEFRKKWKRGLAVMLGVVMLAGQMPVYAESDKERDIVIDTVINALPTVEEVKAMNEEDRNTAYNKTQEAYEAYAALTEDKQVQVDIAKIEELFGYFNGLASATATVTVPGEITGEVTLDADVTIGDGQTLTVQKDATLIVPSEKKLTVQNGGSLINNGTIKEGVIEGKYGSTFTRGENNQGTYTLKVTKSLPIYGVMELVATPYGIVVQSLLGPGWGRPQYRRGSSGNFQDSPIFTGAVVSGQYYMQTATDGAIFKATQESTFTNLTSSTTLPGREL